MPIFKYVIFSMGVVMSIEQEKFDSENVGADSSLEQYGVWVKKSSEEAGDDGLSLSEEIDVFEAEPDVSIVDDDFSFDSDDIFSDEAMDFEIENNIETQNDLSEDTEDTTLTTDELLNITSGIELTDSLEPEEKTIDADFDNFMEIDTSDEMSLVDEKDDVSISQEANNIEDQEDISFDDFMSDVEETTDDLGVIDIDSDDLDTAFDEFIISETEGTDSVEIEDTVEEDSSVMDMDMDMDMDFDSNVTSSIELGEEISIDDIPDIEDDFIDNVEKEEESKDYYLNVQTSNENNSSINSTNANNESSAILDKIITELSALRNEMVQFKGELQQIKSGSQKSSESQEDGGFFSDYEGDDTIALSGDELNNILTSADFTMDDKTESGDSPVDAITENEEETIQVIEEEQDSIHVITDSEEDTNDLDMDEFSDDFFGNDGVTLSLDDKELEEPTLDDLNIEIEEEDSLPDEIDVPVIDNLVVDSSPIDFFDDEQDEEKELDDTAMEFLSDNTALDTESQGDSQFVFGDDDDTFSIDDELSSDISDESIVDTSVQELDVNSPMSTVFKGDQWDSQINEDDFDTNQPNMNSGMQEEIKSVLSYMDRLLESLPEDKISEFAQSEYFGRYKKLFSDLGIS